MQAGSIFFANGAAWFAEFSFSAVVMAHLGHAELEHVSPSRAPDAKRRKDVWSTPRRRQRGSRIGLHFSCIAHTIAIISWVVRSSLNLCGVYCFSPHRNVEALFGDLEGPRRPLKTGKVCCKSTATGCKRVVKSGNGRFPCSACPRCSDFWTSLT